MWTWVKECQVSEEAGRVANIYNCNFFWVHHIAIENWGTLNWVIRVTIIKFESKIKFAFEFGFIKFGAYVA